MAERSFPHDIDPDTALPQLTFEEDFSELLYTAVPDGVLEGLAATAVGQDVQVGAGRAGVRGYGYVSTDFTVLPVPLEPTSNPRTDRIVLRLNRSANTARLHYLQGSPQANQSTEFGNMPPPPNPSRTPNIWDVLLYRVRRTGNNSSVYTLHDERTRQILPPSAHATFGNLLTYSGVLQMDGFLGYLNEEGQDNDTFPRFFGIRNGALTEIKSVGPWRQLRKSGSQSVGTSGDWANVSGWTSIHTEHRPFGNTGITLTDGGFRVNYTGFWEFSFSIALDGGGTGAAHARLRNTNTGEFLTAYRNTSGTSRTSADLHDFMWARKDDLLRLEVFRSAAGPRTVVSGNVTRISLRLDSGRMSFDG